LIFLYQQLYTTNINVVPIYFVIFLHKIIYYLFVVYSIFNGHNMPFNKMECIQEYNKMTAKDKYMNNNKNYNNN